MIPFKPLNCTVEEKKKGPTGTTFLSMPTRNEKRSSTKGEDEERDGKRGQKETSVSLKC